MVRVVAVKETERGDRMLGNNMFECVYVCIFQRNSHSRVANIFTHFVVVAVKPSVQSFIHEYGIFDCFYNIMVNPGAAQFKDPCGNGNVRDKRDAAEATRHDPLRNRASHPYRGRRRYPPLSAVEADGGSDRCYPPPFPPLSGGGGWRRSISPPLSLSSSCECVCVGVKPFNGTQPDHKFIKFYVFQSRSSGSNGSGSSQPEADDDEADKHIHQPHHSTRR